MPKLLCLIMALFVLSSASYAGGSDLFDVDIDEIEAEFSALNELEEYLLENENVNIADLNPDLLAKTGMTLNTFDTFGNFTEPPMGIPSFLWGCVFGVTGVLVVYMIAEDQEETKKALYGCATQSVTVGGCYVMYILLIVSSAAT